jgi:hypothetical protein
LPNIRFLKQEAHVMAFSLASLFKPKARLLPVPQTPRDRHLPPDYWGRAVAFQSKLLADVDDGLKPYRDDQARRTTYRFELEWKPAKDLVRLMYSGGYDLADLADAMARMFLIKRDLDADYRALNPKEKPYGLYGWGYGSDYELMMENLCWLVCLFDRPALAAYIAHCNPPGADRLLDLIAAATVEPDRPVAATLAFPKRWTPLLEVADAAPEARPALLVKAYKKWKRHQPDKGLPPEGATTVLDGSYKGYWAWEVALVAAVFDVDDTALRAEGNYPADLVANARERAGAGGRAL